MILKKIISAGVISILTLYSCTTKEKNTEKDLERVINAKESLRQVQKDFIEESEKKVIENKKRIDELKKEISDTDKMVREEYLKRINLLEKKNNELKGKLTDYTEEGKEKWEAFKLEFNHDMEILVQALKDFIFKDIK